MVVLEAEGTHQSLKPSEEEGAARMYQHQQQHHVEVLGAMPGAVYAS